MAIRNYTKSIIVGCSVVLLASVAVMVPLSKWHTRRSVDEVHSDASADRSQVLSELADARAEMARLQAALDTFKAAARERYNAEDAVALGRLADELAQTPAVPSLPETPAKPKPPEPNALKLIDRHVVGTEDGLLGTMRFSPTKDEPLTMLWLVVRLPKGSSERILDMAPADADALDDVSLKIAQDGKFAALKGIPQGRQPMDFKLSVSGPVVAHVRGTCGIEPFEFNMQAGGVPPARE